MFRIRARVEGTQDLAKAFTALSSRVSTNVLTEALMEGAEVLRAAAARQAPRAPGKPDLAENLVAAPMRRRGGRDQASVGIGPNATFFFYDLFQEFGTVHHAAQPFYRPALDRHGQQALSVILSAIRRELVTRGVLASARTAAPGGLR
jgi:HK97 gp10 family phage protein